MVETPSSFATNLQAFYSNLQNRVVKQYKETLLCLRNCQVLLHKLKNEMGV